MSEEEKKVETPNLEELQAELERLKEENGRLKSAQSNASADAAKWKKEAREKMDEKARAEAETAELIEQLKAENERMKREQEIALRTAAYVGLGFDGELAKKAAEAYGSDHDSFMTSFKTFLSAHDKALLADQLRATPRPGNGGSDVAVSKEQFEHMSYKERAKLYEEQPDLYQELIK